jgi:hypothetical protein
MRSSAGVSMGASDGLCLKGVETGVYPSVKQPAEKGALEGRNDISG